MKKCLSLVILLLALLLAGCRPAQTPTPTTAPEGLEENTNSSEQIIEAPTETGEAAGGAYPNPSLPYPFPTGVPYPGPGGGETIDWLKAAELITTGQVTQIVQGHDLSVVLTLTDGSKVNTTQPSIDEVLKLIEQCGELCRNIVIATE